ncbi:MAG: hypothetical protein IJX89_00875 [Alphaproteobacteria bacterium]|nr:hypothetical protein [Alphaproteobacteria bacterium]
MRKRIFCALSVLSCVLATPSLANWQYPGTYVGDGWYQDDGSRFVISVRGGAAMGFGSIKNEVGAISNEYYMSPDASVVVSATYYDACVADGGCDGYVFAGLGELSDLPAGEDFETFSFAAGASIGWTIPNRPQWRIEAGWDHISESEYNASPMFDGDLTLTGGESGDVTISAQSGAVSSKVTTDIISIMAFYDFFDGLQKPTRTVIPYIGFGAGYADTKTVLNLSDPYGDLSSQVDLLQFGELDDYNVVQFYRSEKNSSNVAGLLALGLSYGITETMFLDFGVRVAYIPKIKWALTNVDDTRSRNFFAAENVIYANIMLGLRFEF